MKVVLIGGHPKGYNEPFHIKTRSGQVLRKILKELDVKPTLFNLWKNQKQEDSRILSIATKNKLESFKNEGYKIIALGRYIEESIKNSGYQCEYLPHPASRDVKYKKMLKNGLAKIYSK